MRTRAGRSFGRPQQRAENAPTDEEVWTRLYEQAIAAGKAPEHAVAAADVGARAFKMRFPRLMPQAVAEAAKKEGKVG